MALSLTLALQAYLAAMAIGKTAADPVRKSKFAHKMRVFGIPQELGPMLPGKSRKS